MHAHGGAHFLGGGAMAAQEGAMIAASAGIEVISVDYTLSTEGPFPAALNDLVAVYQELLKTFPASAIAVGGSSAGGNLTLATVLKLKDSKLKVPGALFVGTPNADLLFTGDSIITNEYVDNTLVTVEGMIRASAKVYAGEYELTNPLISPLYGDFSDFPPTYLVSGTRDLLLSDTVKVHRKLRDAGIETDLNIFEGIPHGAYLAVPGSKEFNGALGDLKTFLQRHL
jgi:acetyl esterase/lipase